MKLYRVIKKQKCVALNDWKPEAFLTGGKLFPFKEAHEMKKKMKNMCSGMLYKVERVL